MRGKVSGSLQAFLLALNSQEDERAAEPDARILQHPGNLENGCDARGIVHRAVVDCIAIDRLAHTQVIEMPRQDNILVLHFWIIARQKPSDVLRFLLRLLEL